MNRFIPWLLAAASFLLWTSPPLGAATLLIQKATIHPVSGPSIQGDLLARDGRIVSIEPSITATADQVVDASGLHLYPGLIAASTQLGLLEINAVRATRDDTEVGEFIPDVVAWTAVNPDSELIPVARANGISHVHAVPGGALVSGISSVLQLHGWSNEEMAFKRQAGLHMFWPSQELNLAPKEWLSDPSKYKSPEDQAKDRARRLADLEEFFQQAESYRHQVPEGARDHSEYHPAWEAVRPFVSGKLPIHVHADTVREIKGALEMASRRGWQIVLVGGRDAWKIADKIAEKKVPVIYEHFYTQPPREEDTHDVQFRAPGVLRTQGVKICMSLGLSGFATSNARNLPYVAAQAIAHGLNEDDALKSITLWPAEVLGIASELGSLEPGKQATFFLSTGDILDIRSNVRQMWIAGDAVSLETRHTRLYNKYKNRPAPKKP